MRYEYRPLVNWPGPVTDPRPACRFKAADCRHHNPAAIARSHSTQPTEEETTNG